MPWAGFESSRAMPPEAAPSGPADRFVSDFSATAASELGGVSRLVMEGAANQEVIDRVDPVEAEIHEPVVRVG